MKKSVFSQWFAVLLLFSAFVWASVSTTEAAAMGNGSNAPASDPTAVDTIKQLEQLCNRTQLGGGRWHQRGLVDGSCPPGSGVVLRRIPGESVG
jgi:hypothetical protein